MTRNEVIKASQSLKIRVSEPQKQLIRAVSNGNMSAFVLKAIQPAINRAVRKQGAQ